MWKKGKTGGKNYVRRRCLFENDQDGIPKDKTLTKPMVLNSLNYNLAEKLIRQKKVNYVQKGGRKISLKFQKPVIDIGDIVYVHLMEGDSVVMNRQPTLH